MPGPEEGLLSRSVSMLRTAFRNTPMGKAKLNSNLRSLFPGASEADLQAMIKSKPYTMTSWERLWAVVQSVHYVHARGIAGDYVECGVWRGGSSMAAAFAFMEDKDTSRTFWLYDTYEGMPKPRREDMRLETGESAMGKWLETTTGKDSSDWCYASLEDVTANFALTGYPAAKTRLIQGKVEDTLIVPANLPEKISILRLDTDWYESTKIELEVLFSRLTPGGVLILDDYGWWAGVKKAVDEFLVGHPPYLLTRIDNAGRMLIKA